MTNSVDGKRRYPATSVKLMPRFLRNVIAVVRWGRLNGS